MQEHVCAFIQSVSEAFQLQGPICEFGYSPGVDPSGGATLEGSFPEKGYLASQECEPAEIDRLEDLVRLPFPNGAVRTVISINTLEHVFEPRRAMEEMIRILAPGGLLIISSASAAESRARPDCYWQPTPHAIQRLLAGLQTTLIGWQGANPCAHTLFGIASKPPVAETFLASVNRFLDGFQRRLDEAGSQSGWWQRLKRLLTDWSRDSGEENPGLLHRKLARQGQAPEKRKRCAPRLPRDFYNAQFVLHLPAAGQFKHQLLAGCLPKESTGSRLDTSQ